MDKKIALIHKIKNDLKISDSEYRDILLKSAGVSSSKELDEAGFKKVMKYFSTTDFYKKNSLSITLKQKMYIKHLGNSLKWETSHLENYIKKYYHKDVEQLSKKEASNLIIGLSKILECSKK